MCARVADEYKCTNIVVLDMTTVTTLYDYFVIGTGINPRHMGSVADETDRILEEQGSQRIGMEGRGTSSWILHDYGDVVVHLFSEESRELYSLESLWSDARIVDWEEED